MKRMVSMVLAILLLATLFAGCAPALEATYKLKKINGMSVREFLAQFDAEITEESVRQLENRVDLTLNKDGSIDSVGEVLAGKGTWTREGDKVTLVIGGATKVCTFKKGELTFEDGDMTMTLGQ